MFSNNDKKFERVPNFPGASREQLPPEASAIATQEVNKILTSIQLADQYLGPQAEVLDRIINDQIEVEEDEAA